MHEAYATTAGSPKMAGDKTCTVFPETCTVSPLQAAITNLIKMQNPHKAWVFVSDLFGLKERSAKHRLANERSYTIEELQRLIQGEDGLQYLDALMADAESRWWWWAKRVMAIAARRRQAAEIDQEILKLETSPLAEAGARRRIKGDIDASKNVGAKLSQAEAALGFLAPNSDRAGRGAMAPTKAQAVRTVGGRGR